MDLGVTYIPWEKVKVDDLEGFAEGGMIDQETVNTGKNSKGTGIVLKSTLKRLKLIQVFHDRVNCDCSSSWMLPPKKRKNMKHCCVQCTCLMGSIS